MKTLLVLSSLLFFSSASIAATGDITSLFEKETRQSGGKLYLLEKDTTAPEDKRFLIWPNRLSGPDRMFQIYSFKKDGVVTLDQPHLETLMRIDEPYTVSEPIIDKDLNYLAWTETTRDLSWIKIYDLKRMQFLTKVSSYAFSNAVLLKNISWSEGDKKFLTIDLRSANGRIVFIEPEEGRVSWIERIRHLDPIAWYKNEIYYPKTSPVEGHYSNLNLYKFSPETNTEKELFRFPVATRDIQAFHIDNRRLFIYAGKSFKFDLDSERIEDMAMGEYSSAKGAIWSKGLMAVQDFRLSVYNFLGLGEKTLEFNERLTRYWFTSRDTILGYKIGIANQTHQVINWHIGSAPEIKEIHGALITPIPVNGSQISSYQVAGSDLTIETCDNFSGTFSLMRCDTKKYTLPQGKVLSNGMSDGTSYGFGVCFDATDPVLNCEPGILLEGNPGTAATFPIRVTYRSNLKWLGKGPRTRFVSLDKEGKLNLWDVAEQAQAECLR